MKAFQMSDQPNIIEFTNYDKIGEEIIFENVFNLLNKNDFVKLSGKITGPSEDIYNYSFQNEPFTLINDFDYGPNIKSNNADIIKRLIAYFNE